MDIEKAVKKLYSSIQVTMFAMLVILTIPVTKAYSFTVTPSTITSTPSDLAFNQAVTSVSREPRSIATGDFNGDGKADLVTANYYSDDLSVLLGNGDGTFQAAVNYAALDATPYAVITGDFNGDGKVDLATANYYGDTASILLGNGDGTFQTAVGYGAGSYPFSLAIGDFNGDSRLDIAVANSWSSDVSILLGNGNGTFQTAVNYATGDTPYSVITTDFNGDNKIDLATANYLGDTVSVLLGNGNGTFQTAVDYGVGTDSYPLPSPFSLATGDFNGDGKADLVTANSESDNVSILLGNGNGTFQSAVNYGAGSYPQSLAIGDFNGDGRTDLATANYVGNNTSVLIGNGDGTFGAAVNLSVGTNPISVISADINGNGKKDLAVANNGSNNASVLLNSTPYGSISPAIPQSVSGGGTISFTVTPDTGYHIDSVTGSGCSIPLSENNTYITGAITSDCTVVAAFAINTYTLTVSKSESGTGSGTITSVPAGINCGDSCLGVYNYGTTVTLTAAPDASSTFTGWSGACTGTGACSVTMSMAKSVTATFTLKTLALTVTKDGNGSGTITSEPVGVSCNGDTCSGVYNYGTAVTLAAAPDASSTFTGWGGACSGTGICTVPMDAAKSVTATFTLKTLAHTVTKDGNGSGTITSAPSGINCGNTCLGVYNYGTAVTLTAAPDISSTFSGWSGACTGTGTCIVTMNEERSVTATFTLKTFTVTPSAGTGGSITPAIPQTMEYGSTVSFTVISDTGYVSVTGCGGSLSGNTYTTGAITEDCTVTINFITVGSAVDNNSLTWTTGGNSDWIGQGGVSYYGGSSAKSGDIPDNQLSWLETTATGPGILSFHWKVSSEAGYDYLRFYIDDNEQPGGISGEVDWQQKSYTIPEGNHVLRWEYSKDGSASNGSDSGWIDKVELCDGSLIATAGATPDFAGGMGSVNVTAVAGSCSWTAESNTSWITITSGGSGTGSGTVSYFAAPGPELAENITVAGQGVMLARHGTGGLDAAFNNNGLVTYSGGGNDSGNSVAVQPDGRIVVAGRSYNGSNNDLLVIRYNSDGTLDAGFGSNGILNYDSGYDDSGNSVAVQPDGRIVVAGRSYNGSNNDLLVLSYNSNGTPDDNFGSNGVVTYDGGSNDSANSVAVQSDGKIVVAGSTFDASTWADDVLFLRYSAEGLLDAGFGSNGVVTYDGGSNDSANSVAVQSDGKIVVAGSTFDTSTWADDALLLRYSAEGLLDTTFGSNGAVTYDSGNNDYGSSVAIQEDGKIVVAGYTFDGSYASVLVMRYTTDGTPDLTFNATGITTYGNVANDSDHKYSLAITGDGKIVVAGHTYNGSDDDLLVMRYSSDGTLDASFGSNGVVTYNDGYGYADSVAIQADGKIVISGHTYNGSNGNLLVMRLIPAIPTITSGAGANGSISPSGDTTVNYGASQTYTITPDSGYHVADVKVDGVSVGVVASYTFSNITTNHTITASFAIDTSTVTGTSTGNGGISPTSQIVSRGSTATFTVTPDTGYHASVGGTCGGSLVGNTYTTNSVTSDCTVTASFAIDTFTITSSAGANGSISPLGSTTVNYGTSQTYTITPDSGYHVADVKVDGVSVGVVASYIFTNITANHTITAIFAVDVHYTVTATSGANGTISPSSQTASTGSSATFTVTPAAGYHAVMGGTCGGTLIGNTYTTNSVTSDCTVTASFAVDTFTITSSAGANGSISPLGSTTVNYGTSQTYTITPNIGYHIVDVIVDGVSAGAVTSYPFSNITSHHSITASFAIDTYTVTGTSTGNGSISPSSQTASTGSSATFTVTPAAGYHAVMGGTCGGTLIGNTYTTNSVTSDCTVTATFAIDTFTITATAGNGGSIDPSGNTTVNYGTSQTYTITPNTGYHIVDVIVDGVSAGAVTTYTFSNVTGNHTITASFAVDTYTVTGTSGANGTISPSSRTVNTGSKATFTVTSDTGHHTVMGGTCGGTLVGNTYTTNSVTSDCTVTATFAVDTFTITSSASANGSISPLGSTTVNYGTSQTYMITADIDSHIVDVVVDGLSVGAIASYTFTNVTTNHVINANFAPTVSVDTYIVTGTSTGNGTISPLSQTVSTGSSATFTVTPAAGYHAVMGGTCGGTLIGNTYTTNSVTSDCTVTASFAVDTFTITSSAGANGSISPLGSTTVNYGTSQTYMITAGDGYHVADVKVDGVSVGAVTSYPFSNITSHHSITASFAIDTYTVTGTSTGNGSISPSSQTASTGSSATFTVTPAAGYHAVMGGTCGGTLIGNTYTTNSMTSDCTVTATFAIDTFTITATAGNGGSIDPSGNTTVNYGTSQTYTITPNTGYHIVDVIVDGVSAGAVTTYTFSNVTGNHTITASFAIDTYTVTATSGANGTISPLSQIVSRGSTATFTVTPDPGHHATVEDTCGGTLIGNTYTTNSVTSDCTVTATFAVDTFTITSSAGANGSISPLGSTTVNYGTSQTYMITPNSGYHMADVKVDGVSVGIVTTYAFNNITSNHTITATFATDFYYTVTGTSNTNGAINPSSQTVSTGSTATFAVTPNTGYHSSVTGSCGGSLVGNTYTTNSVTSDCTVTASFAIDTFTITSGAGANGSISPSGDTTVNYGTSRTYTITPDTGYHVLDVVVDGASIGAVTSYTFSNITTNHTITASFAIDTYILTLTRSGMGTGIITSSPEGVNCGNTCSKTYNYGSTVTLTATPDVGSTFAGWSGGGCSGTGTCTVAMDAAKDITATFNDATAPAFSSILPTSHSYINTSIVSYVLSETVNTGRIIFSWIGGTSDSASHTYDFQSLDSTVGNHNINTGFQLVDGAIYTATFEAADVSGNTVSVARTNIVYDTSAASMAITIPSADSVINSITVIYTLSEDITSGDIVFTWSGGATDSTLSHKYSLRASERTKGNHTVNTGAVLKDGAIYTVELKNVTDLAGNSTPNVSNASIKYDSTAVVINNTLPASNSIITAATIGYTLSEEVSTGKVTFTWMGGNADNDLMHVYNLSGTELTGGAHIIDTGLSLVNGAFYTVSFDATDLVGNSAATVSNAMVYYDSNYDSAMWLKGNTDNVGFSANRIDGYDLIKLSISFGSEPGDPNWNPVCDLNSDGRIDGNDLIILGTHFGEVGQ